jgi:hypothetical protein
MSIELTRAAHYEGDGLPHPVDIWRGDLDEATEVYFTHPYDRALGDDVPTLAMTVRRRETDVARMSRYEFEDVDGMLTAEYRAMLGHAAIFRADVDGGIRPTEDADQFEVKERTHAALRHAQIYRSRFISAPPHE